MRKIKFTLQVFEISVSGEWLVLEKPVFDSSGKRMAFVMNTMQSDGSKYRHINLLDLTQTSPTAVPLTSGNFTVSEIAAWDADEDMMQVPLMFYYSFFSR